MKVLITGASRGVGFALSRAYKEKGYEVFGIARNFSQNWPGDTFLECDLSTIESMENVEKFLEESGSFDVCIHNLGINKSGPFLKSTKEELQQMSFANLTFPILLTQLLIKNKGIKNDGSIIYINSLSHYVSYPGSAFYAATKDGLHSFVRSMRLKCGNYHFMSVYPGPVDTDQARENSPLESGGKRMSAKLLAQKIYKAQQSRKSLLVPGLSIKTVAMLSHLVPGAVESMMYKTIYKPMKK